MILEDSAGCPHVYGDHETSETSETLSEWPEPQPDSPEHNLQEMLEPFTLPRASLLRVLDWVDRYSTSTVRETTATQFEKAIRWLVSQPNPVVAAGALMFASGANELMGMTMTKFARRHGVTRATISKTAVQIATGLNLAESPYMKRSEMRGHYAEAQRKNHWRNW